VKSLLASTFSESLETQMELEARGIAAMAGGADGREGIEAFVAKRAPKFSGTIVGTARSAPPSSTNTVRVSPVASDSSWVTTSCVVPLRSATRSIARAPRP
jgi:hypothetical protein